nr:hypothetical protein [Kiritimatiellia bacterium]
MKSTGHVMVWAWLVAGVISVWAQGLLICGRCGREAQPGSAVCRHCQAALPQPKTDAPTPQPAAPAVPDAADEVGRMAGSLVEACVRQARDIEAKQPELALAYYQNALALMRLVPSGTFPASAGEAILAGNARTLQVLQRGAVPCRHCGGSGRYQLDLSKVDRRKGVKAVEGLPCAACKGAGTVPGFREVAKVKMLILQGRSEFERRQMVAGEVKVGRVLVPPALDRLLTNRQRALIMTGMPLPCRDCQMSGRKLCTACRGSGWKTCDYTGCDNGALQEPRTTGTRKEKRLNEDEVKK